MVLVSWGLLFIASGCTEQTRWQRIIFVPERVTEVLAVEDPVSLPGSLSISIYAIPSLNLYVRTQQGSVYRCRRSAEPPACDPIGPEQVPTVRIPQSLRYDHCDSSAEAVTKAPGQIVDTIELCGSYDPAAPLVYSKIVVLEDGGVWEWYIGPSPGALTRRICPPYVVWGALLLLGVVIIVRVTAVARSTRR